jgi:hypothetical protein
VNTQLAEQITNYNDTFGEAWYAFGSELRAYCKDLPEEGYYTLADFGDHPDGRRRAALVASMFNALQEE